MSLPEHPELKLIIKRSGLILNERDVDQDVMTVGRDADCDVVLDHPSVSRRAAEFHFEGGELWAVDAGSLDGITIDGEAIERRRVRPGDEVGVGPFAISIEGDADQFAAAEATREQESARPVAGPDDTIVLGAAASSVTITLPDGTRHELAPGSSVVGRDAGCDLVVANGAVSKRHAEIVVAGGEATIRDLGSTNGTTVNGAPASNRPLRGGDRIGLGDQILAVAIGGGSPDATVVIAPPEERTVVTGPEFQDQIRRQAEEAARARGKSSPPKRQARPLLRVLLGAMLVVAVLFLVLVILLPSEPEPVPVPPADETAETPAAEPQELFRQGLEAYREGEVETALASWESAIAADPSNAAYVDRYAQTLYRVGLIYEGDQQYERAVAAWRRLVDTVRDRQHDYVIKAAARLQRYQ